MLLLLVACVTTEGSLSLGCPAVRFSEVMSASQTYAVVDGDWFELENTGDAEVDLSGLLLLRRGQTAAYEVREGTIVAPGGFQLFLASTYVDPDAAYPTTRFDLNADSDSLQLRSNSADAYELCDEVLIPPSHQDFSWERNPVADEWCFASEPSPGAPNHACVCDVSDAC